MCTFCRLQQPYLCLDVEAQLSGIKGELTPYVCSLLFMYLCLNGKVAQVVVDGEVDLKGLNLKSDLATCVSSCLS